MIAFAFFVVCLGGCTFNLHSVEIDDLRGRIQRLETRADQIDENMEKAAQMLNAHTQAINAMHQSSPPKPEKK